jgi:6-phosphogluconate dehydrogenase
VNIGMVGLGKMGANMTRRLLGGGHRVLVFDLNKETVRLAEANGAEGCSSLEEVISRLDTPRVLWVMVPAGDATEETVNALASCLSAGDVIVDGGNSPYKHAIERSRRLKARGIHFIDVGTSGGVFGLENGYALMIGGEPEVVDMLTPIFETLAPNPQGFGRVGPSGAGHFTKMVHNAIEYGAMQAYAEGFQLLKNKQELDLNLEGIASIWRHGSVIRSWLLDLISLALEEDPNLKGIAPYVEDSGEGRWSVQEAFEQETPVPVITLALMERYRSREQDSFAYKLLAAMRNRFGGHAVRKAPR